METGPCLLWLCVVSLAHLAQCPAWHGTQALFSGQGKKEEWKARFPFSPVWKGTSDGLIR